MILPTYWCGPGRSIVSVADEIGVCAGLLGKWIKVERESSGGEVLDTSERAELIGLGKENRELLLDNEFPGNPPLRGSGPHGELACLKTNGRG